MYNRSVFIFLWIVVLAFFRSAVSAQSTITLSVSSAGTTCGYSNGYFTITATGGTAPYSYSANGFWQSGGTFTQKAPGTYNITVKDSRGNSATTTVTLDNTFEQPTINIAGYTNATGCMGADASVTVSATGGTPIYQFSYDMLNFQSSPTFANLVPGNYSFYVKDVHGCENVVWFPLSRDCNFYPPTVDYDATCTNGQGTIKVTGMTSGTAPYQYSIDNINWQTSTEFDNLAYGRGILYFKDANGQESSWSYPLYNVCTLDVTPNPISATCGKSDGGVILVANNGYGPYTYSTDGVHYQESSLVSNLSPGTYTFYAKDVYGHTGKTTMVVPSGCFVVIATKTDDICGKAEGSISATATGGTTPYQYSLDGTTYQSSASFAGLLGGNYTVYSRDGAGANTSTKITVGTVAGPSADVIPVAAGCLNNDGKLTVTAAGGTAPFSYSLDAATWQTNSVFSGLAAGDYMVTVLDANGCSIAQPSTITLTNTATANAGPDETMCQGKSVTLQAASNASQFSWTPTEGLSSAASLQPSASPATTTTYTLLATLGACQQTSTVTVNVNSAPTAVVPADTAVCIGKSVQLQGSGGVSYSWSPATYLDNASAAAPISTPKASISYSLVVTDGNGCQSLNNPVVKVGLTPPPHVFAGADTTIAVGEPFQLHAEDVNQSGFYDFAWSPFTGLDDPYSQNPVAILSSNMTYTVTALAPGGCVGSGKIDITVYKGPDIYVPSAFTPNSDGHNDLLKAKPVGITSFHYFAVYDRFGVQVFQTKDPALGWDGYFNGHSPITGTYVWMAEGIDYNGKLIRRKGTVVLIQ